MTHASDAYAALNAEMEYTTPSCANNPVFTADTHNPAQLEAMKELCEDCPLALLCLEYARAARPTAGIWAGKNWTQIPRKEKA